MISLVTRMTVAGRRGSVKNSLYLQNNIRGLKIGRSTTIKTTLSWSDKLYTPSLPPPPPKKNEIHQPM